MQGWIEQDSDRGDVLVRRGHGLVTAVVPVASNDVTTDGLVRVEIDCDRPEGRPRAVRYRVDAVVAAADPLADQAGRAHSEGLPVEWTVRWVRHEWIPAHLPVTSLNLAEDATAVLCGLEALSPTGTDLDAEWIALLADGSADPS